MLSGEVKNTALHVLGRGKRAVEPSMKHPRPGAGEASAHFPEVLAPTGHLVAENRDTSKGYFIAENRDTSKGYFIAENRDNSKGYFIAENRDTSKGYFILRNWKC